MGQATTKTEAIVRISAALMLFPESRVIDLATSLEEALHEIASSNRLEVGFSQSPAPEST